MAFTTVEYQEVYKRLTADAELGLRGYELTRREWTILTQLRDVFKVATLFFSRGSPSIAAVIPAMDLIDNKLTDAARESNDKLDPAIRTAAGIAKHTLNRYYKISDMSATYRIAMVFHPRHKLRYFERAGWPQHWIKEALTMVREEYDAHYRHLDERVSDPNPDNDVENSGGNATAADQVRLGHDKQANLPD
ncbi:hypothetical protein C8T65DRAFT_587061 [Cerioporus squamosus]|nr:hypothetical protein C8T65DRAFT_587061 [Cerioporus squamosus]